MGELLIHIVAFKDWFTEVLSQSK